ncbi:MAG: hypothetical protein RR954_00825 [Christensenellaceae bacterium]
MFREELSHGKVGAVKGLFITLGIVGAILFGMFVVSFLKFWLNITWPQFVLYGLVIVAGFLIVKFKMTDYIYIIGEDRVVFGRRLGKREKELMFIPLRNINRSGEYEKLKDSLQGKKIYKYTFLKKESAYVIDCGPIAIIFSASEEYKKKLAKKKGGK